MKITISGIPGSGKTTAGKILAKNLGLEFISIGRLRREIAAKRGIIIEELNRIGETEAWTDTAVNEYQKEFGQTHKNFIMDGRLAYHFIPDSIKIFFDVDARIAAERIFTEPRPEEKTQKTVEEAIRANTERVTSDQKRYRKYYNLDPYDKRQFDIVIYASHLTLEETANNLIREIKNRDD